MNQIIDFYKETINKIGIEYTIKYLIIVIGVVLIYMRVIRNFKDAKKQNNNNFNNTLYGRSRKII